MTRRAILFALAALPASAADPAQQAWDLLTGMASTLSTGDAVGFLRAFDPAMKGFDDLRAAVTALVAEAEIESTIDPIQNTGDDRVRTLQVQWSLRLIGRSDLQRVTDRQATVTMRLERQRGKWKVVSFEPASLFAPPSARMQLADQRRGSGLLFQRLAETRHRVGRNILHPDGDGA